MGDDTFERMRQRIARRLESRVRLGLRRPKVVQGDVGTGQDEAAPDEYEGEQPGMEPTTHQEVSPRSRP